MKEAESVSKMVRAVIGTTHDGRENELDDGIALLLISGQRKR